MHVKPSDFGITPRAILDTLKLISISRREVLNIVNVVDCDAPGNATALDRNSFAGMKNALMVYEVFLCGAGFPFAQNDKVNAAYAELNQAWSKLVQTVCRHCTDKKVAKRLSVAWSAAIEELCAILERAKAKTSASKLLYDAFALALDEASDALSKRRRSARTVKKRMAKRKLGELTQEDVAKVFDVSRHTVIRWEREQTEDGSGNTSNPWGYYKSLRTNLELRDAFEMLSNQAKAYIDAKDKAKKQGKRFRMTFERFKEVWLSHNNAKM